MESDTNIDLSVLIVSWNTAKFLQECLKSVFTYIEGLEFEVIVVDNNSSDESVEIVKEQFPSVKLIVNNANKGFVEANNQGFKISKGRNILLLNSDTVILDNSMRKIIGFLDSNPSVGVATGKVLNEDRSFQRPFKRYPHWLGSYFRHTTRLIYGFDTPFHQRYCMGFSDQDAQLTVDWVSGAYLFVKRNALDSETVLDPDIFMYCEDTLLCYSVRQKGYKIYYLPVAPIIHYEGKSAKIVRSFSAYNSFKGTCVFIRKVYGPLKEKILKKAVVLTWLLFTRLLKVCSFLKLDIFNRKKNYFEELLTLYYKEPF